METSKLVNSVLAALLVAFGVYMIVGVALSKPSGLLFLISWALFGWYFYNQPTTRRVWRQSFIYFAILSFLMPVASFIYTAIFVANTSNGLEAAGAVIGGGILMVITGILGFSLGIVFLLIGLLVLKDKEDSKRKPISTKHSGKWYAQWWGVTSILLVAAILVTAFSGKDVQPTTLTTDSTESAVADPAAGELAPEIGTELDTTCDNNCVEPGTFCEGNKVALCEAGLTGCYMKKTFGCGTGTCVDDHVCRMPEKGQYNFNDAVLWVDSVTPNHKLVEGIWQDTVTEVVKVRLAIRNDDQNSFYFSPAFKLYDDTGKSYEPYNNYFATDYDGNEHSYIIQRGETEYYDLYFKDVDYRTKNIRLKLFFTDEYIFSDEQIAVEWMLPVTIKSAYDLDQTCESLGCPGAQHVGNKANKQYYTCTCNKLKSVTEENRVCFKDYNALKLSGYTQGYCG